MSISPDTAFLRAEGITKRFSDNMVLENVDLSVRKGELVSIIGVSGSGKTTLFNILSGLMRPDAGHVYLHDTEITGRPGKISYMLQKDLLLPYRTVVDNVALPLLIRGMPKKEAREKAASYFRQFGLSGTEKKYPDKLSGGMRQRAALLRTYLASDGVALLDEPFSALDAITKNAIHEWYLDIMHEIELTTLFITHDMDEAIKLSDRICVLSGHPGQIVREISVTEPRPRAHDFSLMPEFLNYKRQLLL